MNHGMRVAGRVIALLLSTLLLTGGLSLLTAPVANAATASRAAGISLPAGPGHTSGPVWAGNWSLNGKRGYCIDFSWHNPDGGSSNVVSGNLPGMTAEESARAKFITNTYANTNSDVWAAGAALAIWKIQGGSAFNTYFKFLVDKGHAKDARAKMATILEASKTHAPYKVVVKSNVVLVGQDGKGSVTVTGSNGKPAAGRSVTLSTNDRVRITSDPTLKTNFSGVVRFTFKRVNVGTARINARVVSPSSGKVILSTPSAGNQRLIQGVFQDVASGYTSFDKKAGAPTITSSCTDNCNGIAPVTSKACNPAGARAIRWFHMNGTTKVAHQDTAGGACSTKTFKVADGVKLTKEYCYLDKVGGTCVTSHIKVAGVFEVICPPWVKVTGTFECQCEGGIKFNFNLAAPGGVRYYTARVKVDGVVVGGEQKLGKAGTSVVENVLVKNGQTVSVEYTAWRNADYTGKLRTGMPFSVTLN